MAFGFGRARLLVAAILFLVVAVGLTVREGLFLVTWPEVETTVVATRIIEEASGGTDSHPLYRPEVSVRYALNGRLQEGHAVSTYWSKDRADAEQVVAQFRTGTRPVMRYDPSNPTDLRFDAEASLDAFKVPLFSAGMGLFLFILWLVLRRT
jgi:hypothetical protein